MYHWKHIGYRAYRLTGPSINLTFDEYHKLYSYCRLNNINAQQA